MCKNCATRYEKMEELLSWLNLCNDIKETVHFYMDDDASLVEMPEDSFEELLQCWDTAEDMVLRWLDELNEEAALSTEQDAYFEMISGYKTPVDCQDLADLDDEEDFDFSLADGDEFEIEWEWDLPEHDQTDWDEDFTSEERVLINAYIAGMKRKNVFEAALDAAFKKAGL